MAIRVLEMPENDTTVLRLKEYCKDLMKKAQVLPENWYPKRYNGLFVAYMSQESATLVLEENAQHRVEFTYGEIEGEPVWDIVEDTFTNEPIKDFVMLLP